MEIIRYLAQVNQLLSLGFPANQAICHIARRHCLTAGDVTTLARLLGGTTHAR